MTYDGTIRFDTRIDTSDLDSQMSGLESKLSRSTAKLRDIMQGPIAAFKEMAHVAGQIKGEFDKLEAAWASQERASAILKATLEATGASAWTSAKEIEGMAESLQDMTAYGDDAVLMMQNVLLGFKNIKGDNFKEATTAILDMATVMGMDLTSAAQAVGKALDDPVQGMDSLSRQGFKFTEQQKDMLKALVESGKIEEAQGIILKELATTYGGAAEAAAGTASAIKDKLNNALGDLQEEAGRTISEALKPMRENLIEVINGFTDWFKVMNENGDMPELLNKITTGLLAVTAAMAEFVLVSKGAAIVNTMTLAIQGLSKALAANWVALAAAGAVAAITLIIGKIKEHKLEQEEAARAAEEQARKTDELKNSVVSLATEYQNLYDKTNPTADEQQRMLDIANQLHTLYPTLTNDVIEYAAKNSNLATSIKEVALAQERVNLASLLGKKEAINQNIIEVQLAKHNAKTAIERTTYENMQAALEEQLKKVQGEIKIVEGRIAILDKTTKPTTAESAGGTVPSKEAPKVEKSQGERLQELDAKYKAQIEAEKELGHDTTEIERQYYKERYDLLMDFIAEDAKAGLSFENSFKSRLKGLNTTLGDELAETDRILSDFDAADTAKAKGDAYTKYIDKADSELQKNEDEYEQEALNRLKARNKERLSLLAQLHGKSADYIASEGEKQEWLAGRYEWASDEEIAALRAQLEEQKKAEAVQKAREAAYNTYIENRYKDTEEIEDEYEQESLNRLKERNKKRLSLLAQLHGKEADYVATEAERQEWLAGRYEWASDEEIEALQKQLDEKIKVDDEIKKRDTEYINLLKIVNGHTEDYQATQEELVEWLGPNFTHATDEQIRAVKNYLRALGLMSAEYERIDAANGADAQSTGHVATGTEIMTDKVKKATEALKEQADAINNSNQSLGAQIRQLVEFARAAGVSEDAIDALVAAWNSLKQAESYANADKGSAESQALTVTWTEKVTREIKEETLALGDQIKVQELVNQGYDENIAQMILAAQSAGVEKDAIDALIESYINLKKAQENKSIWQQAGIVGEKSITGKVSGGTEVGNLLAGFGIDFGGIIGEMVKSIASLSSVTKLLDPIATIFDGIMSTLGPVIDEVFAPLANMLTQVGIAIGQILAPALQILTPIIQALAKLFVKLYNDVIVPVGNAVIKTFNRIFNAVADVINWILGAINAALGWLVGNIALIEKKNVNSGLLTPISEEDLSAGKAGEIDYEEELKKVNEQLKKNKELFTLASKAADAYKAVLTKVKTAAADFYDSLKDVGSDIADSIINGILNGFSDEDFAYEMQEYLTKAVVKAAVFTESFMAQIAEIGKEIANGIANGFSEDQLRGLRDRLAELYSNAQAAAEVATSLVQDAFTAEPVVVTVPSESAQFGGGGMIIPGSPGATIDLPVHKGLANIGNYVQALMPRFGKAIQAVAYGTVNIDGREIGRIAFDYSDQFQRAMYGA